MLKTEDQDKNKSRNGIHFGVGAGVTYNNWNAELAYNSNTHKLSVTDTKRKRVTRNHL